MTPRTSRLTPVLVVVLGLAIACGASAEAADPAPPLTDVERLATIEGSWMCDVQRFAVDDLREIDTKLDIRLDDEGFDRTDYDQFKTELAERPELRVLVLEAFNQACIG